MISQGAKANFSGQDLEDNLSNYLKAKNIPFIKQYKYAALWKGKRDNKVDFLIDDRIVVECKNQNVSGTADMKGFAEIWNAYKKFPNKTFILVYGGVWWDTPRGSNIFKAVSNMAKELSNNIQVLREIDFERKIEKIVTNT